MSVEVWTAAAATLAVLIGALVAALMTWPRISPPVAGMLCAAAGEETTRNISVASATSRAGMDSKSKCLT